MRRVNVRIHRLQHGNYVCTIYSSQFRCISTPRHQPAELTCSSRAEPVSSAELSPRGGSVLGDDERVHPSTSPGAPPEGRAPEHAKGPEQAQRGFLVQGYHAEVRMLDA